MAVSKYYRKRWSEELNVEKWSMPIVRLNYMLSFLKEEKGEVLDVGCGNGELGNILVKKGLNVQGVDINQETLDHCDFPTKQLDLNKGILPFNNDFFDIAVCAEVLEHLFNPKDILGEIYRVLKPYGTLIVSIPNFVHILNRLKILFGIFEYFPEHEKYIYMNEFGHIRHFTLKSFNRIMTQTNFKILEIKNVVHPRKMLLTEIVGKLPFPGFYSCAFIAKCKKTGK